jgi:hypothetical protein
MECSATVFPWTAASIPRHLATPPISQTSGIGSSCDLAVNDSYQVIAKDCPSNNKPAAMPALDARCDVVANMGEWFSSIPTISNRKAVRYGQGAITTAGTQHTTVSHDDRRDALDVGNRSRQQTPRPVVTAQLIALGAW